MNKVNFYRSTIVVQKREARLRILVVLLVIAFVLANAGVYSYGKLLIKQTEFELKELTNQQKLLADEMVEIGKKNGSVSVDTNLQEQIVAAKQRIVILQSLALDPERSSFSQSLLSDLESVVADSNGWLTKVVLIDPQTLSIQGSASSSLHARDLLQGVSSTRSLSRFSVLESSIEKPQGQMDMWTFNLKLRVESYSLGQQNSIPTIVKVKK